MKILLFGKNGQIGWELNRSLQPLGEIVALDRAQANFSSPESLRGIIQNVQPEIIVNAAAYTAVDQAEKEEGLAKKINGLSPGIIAEEALKLNALMVHYSTDYVFDGAKTSPYVETDEPNPLNVYGRTKLVGELAVQSSGCDYLMFRTSWVYAARKKNFMLTMLQLAQEIEELSIVTDQIGVPTAARIVADTTVHCIKESIAKKSEDFFSSEIYHLTNSGHTSWHGFAKEIISLAENSLNLSLRVKNIKAITSSDYSSLATRPMNSQLELSKLENAFKLRTPDWRKSLQLSIDELLID